MLLVVIITEWLNMVLKWVLLGHRPYWWVMENMTVSIPSFASALPLWQAAYVACGRARDLCAQRVSAAETLPRRHRDRVLVEQR